MVAQERWAGGAAAGDTCPAPMTRAALIALRDAGQLNIQCHYIVTDHVQNRLIAGTYIELHATDASTLSMHVSVKTPYDNLAWEGRYDIDSGNVIELRDNLNNIAITTAAVSDFDWGNPAIRQCRVEYSTWTVTYGSTIPMTRVRVLDGSTLNTTGMTGGYLQNVEVNKESVVNLSNANLVLVDIVFEEATQLNASGFTAGGTGLQRSSFRDSSVLTLSAGAGAVSVLSSTFESVGTAIHGSAGSFTIQNSYVGQSALIRHIGPSLSFTLSTSRVTGGNTDLTHQGGTVAVNYSSFETYGRIIKPVAATGVLSMTYCHVNTGSYIQQQGVGPINMAGTTLTGTSLINVVAGADTSAGFVVNNSTLSNVSNITIAAASTAGPIAISDTHFSARAYAYKGGTGQLAVGSSTFQSSAYVQVNNSRGLSINYCTAMTGSRILSTAASPGVVDTATACTITDTGILLYAATGAVANQTSYSRITGLTGEISYNGTTTGNVVTRSTADNGIFRLTNNTVALTDIVDIGVRDQAVITIQNNGVAFSFRYNTAQSYGRINVTGKSTGGLVYGIDVQNNGAFNVSGATTDSLYCSVRNGQINHNGGTLRDAHKRMGGILTTGAFNHSNIIHEANASKTLTAANTNRADYMGLAAQLV